MDKKYKYRVVEIKSSEDTHKLNDLYGEGWEFVESITQAIGAQTPSGGYVFYIIKKEL